PKDAALRARSDEKYRTINAHTLRAAGAAPVKVSKMDFSSNPGMIGPTRNRMWHSECTMYDHGNWRMMRQLNRHVFMRHLLLCDRRGISRLLRFERLFQSDLQQPVEARARVARHVCAPPLFGH